MRYRLIAGTINRYEPEEGWTNIHLDCAMRGIWMADLAFAVWPEIIGDVANMVELRDEMFDEVRMHHVLEHLPLERCELAVAEAFRVLKPEGTFDVEVPDMAAIAAAWVNGDHDEDALQQWIYGEQLPGHEPGDSHRFGHWEEEFDGMLTAAGFHAGDRVAPGLAMRYIATKPIPEEGE